jgi:hypothetical protein
MNASMRLAALTLVFLVFTTWSFTIVFGEGFGALSEMIWREPWGKQVFLDLVISLTIAWTWLVPDARARQIPAVPYILGTLVLGSIAVLAYLVHREVKAMQGERASA